MIHGSFNKKMLAAIAAAAFAFGLSSCIKDNLDDMPAKTGPVDNGKVRLALHTNAGSYQVPVTRTGVAANDAEGVDPYGTNRMPLVLVFELPENEKEDYDDAVTANDAAAIAELLRTKAVFKEAALASDEAAPKVTLSATQLPVRLLIVSDPPTKYFYNDGTNDQTPDFTADALNDDDSPLAGKTFAQVVTGILNTPKLAATGNVEAVPYAGSGKYIPATAIYDLAKVETGMSIGAENAKVGLRRIAAKITVVNTAPGFVFEGATVLNTKQYGYLYRDYIPATSKHSTLPTGNKVHYLYGTGAARVTGIAAAVSNTTATNPLYVYESDAGEITLLVQGTYDGTTYWYRLALKDGSGALMAVDRNKHYTVTITEVGMRGYASIAAALAGSDVTGGVSYKVLSSELSGHEIVDNGLYYLGLSNSVFLHCSDNTGRTEVLTTISTNATSGTISVTQTAGDAGITLGWASQTLSGSGEKAYELTATFASGFIAEGKKALYTIKVGALEKQLLVMQQGTSSMSITGEEITEFTGVNYVAANVEEGQDWLSLAMKEGTNYGDYTTEAINSVKAGGTIKVKSESGMTPTDGAARFGAIMATRIPTTPYEVTVGTATFKNTGARVKMSIGQNTLPGPGDITGVGNVAMTTYIGAFWRHDQKGERLINMPVGGGKWVVQVLDYGVGDNAFSEGDILFEPWLDGIPPGDDFPDGDTEALDAGTQALAGTGFVRFKIGLKNTIDETKVRYARIVISYGIDYASNRVIWLRQGDAADNLFPDRPLSMPFSPYNLTATFDDDETASVQIGVREGEFTDYPSQAGAFWQWASKSSTSNATAAPQIYAFSPVSQPTVQKPVLPGLAFDFWEQGYWSGPTKLTSAPYSGKSVASLYESCPKGYRRPTYGTPNNAAVISLLEDVEFYQSLMLTPFEGTATVTQSLIRGCYADGYFDRYPTSEQPYYETPVSTYKNTAVAVGTPDVAYIGYMFYNPDTNASIFFPSAGWRWSDGRLHNPGWDSAYWSSSSAKDSKAWYLHTQGDNNISKYTADRDFTLSIRCVYDPDYVMP